jgi:hypothetical protein
MDVNPNPQAGAVHAALRAADEIAAARQQGPGSDG